MRLSTLAETSFVVGLLCACQGPSAQMSSTSRQPGQAAPHMPAVWYLDADGDGYGDPDTSTSSDKQPDGWVQLAQDCDDGDPSVHPDSRDWCDDGKDQDCDGADRACEVLYATDAEFVIHGENQGDYFGTYPRPAGDVNGDGIDDLWVGSPNVAPTNGAIYLFLGDKDGVLAEDDAAANAHGRIIGGNLVSNVGEAFSPVGDVNGDGYADVLVGDGVFALWSGAAWLYLGPISGDVDREDAVATFTTTQTDAELGTAVRGVGDLDGDGLPDLLVTAPDMPGLSNGEGAIFLLPGTLTGEHAVEREGFRIGDFASYGRLDHGLAASDLDGDGLGDIVVCVSRNTGGLYEYRTLVFLGPFTSNRDWGDADAEHELPMADETEVVGDINGDGLDDVLFLNDYGAVGELQLFTGTDLLEADPFPTAIVLDLDDLVDRGQWASAAGDVDGDGRDDLLVGFHDTPGLPESTAASLLLGPLTGNIDLNSVDVGFVNTIDGDEACHRAAGTGDVDHDGVGDLALSCSGDNTSGNGTGSLRIFLGGL